MKRREQKPHKHDPESTSRQPSFLFPAKSTRIQTKSDSKKNKRNSNQFMTINE